ncbi:2-keto-4-pentenoate hydratase/2-oxohepta-3-ene-1,7-dioic acid hydratase (catechol pathway) [Paenibacillus sp. UNCCL117]|uniref:fumarylacetoacetate hydrolase family protein n=1 Tax=unclassified Paenibacillus TaxID=185978 RepID=UPI0008867BF6|nr:MULTISPECIES: fumarylacetoacetate hydrolase family protein [unclassified Paenibacillus]SDE10279.1 2-keto-4-pentenoate hydratase/2-oxohepta-3-ene-1,7-dioic acid hydratase (catechol pathway) [Paenibacillus sp. cl123]SFW59724.1 2-keto-4-pentenoate hydratase/2-oxohepta-3-ene-1,7-dioic acid hydratase (catechol pathway) [Paenibacillus sp. UNCCL117]
MRWVQFVNRSDRENRLRLGIWTEDGMVRPLQEGLDLKSWIARCAQTPGLARPEEIMPWAGEALPLEEVRLKAPLHNPDKLIFVGLNYRDHAEESKMAVPQVPVLFAKYANSIVGPDEDVIIPAEVRQCDYEVELAVVIGRTARNVPIEDAMDYVFGYTIINDVSARDIQLNEGQWTRGKAIDTFAPMGPCVATCDIIPDPHRLQLSLMLNGQTMQDSNTKELIFDIPYLVSFLSRTITLSPGDIISTGTPPGVGMGRKPPVWLKHGDETAAFVQGIGTLANRYVEEDKQSG